MLKEDVYTQVDYASLLRIGRELLIAIGEDPDREGLQETPRRWADWWREYFDYNPGKMDTCFSSITADQLVCVSGIRIWTLCEHHLLPFWCDISIGYIPSTKILGLSKFARIAQKFAHQLQIQERLGQQIAEEVSLITATEDIAVLLNGEHLCTTMRGVRISSLMTSSIMRGAFQVSSDLRMEFLKMAGAKS